MAGSTERVANQVRARRIALDEPPCSQYISDYENGDESESEDFRP